jgi:hypothetical protein
MEGLGFKGSSRSWKSSREVEAERGVHDVGDTVGHLVFW